MNDTTAPPADLKSVFARYREIAPEPSPDNAHVARELTKYLLLSGVRRDNRLTASILEGKTVSAEELAGLIAEFAASYLMQELVNSEPAIADEAAKVIAGARLDGSAGGWVRGHAQALGVDIGEVDRLAEAEAALKAAKAGESDAARADRLQQACITLGRTFDHLAESMYAARIEIQQGDHKAACEWILNAMEGTGDGEPGAGWDGSETAQEWMDRTRAAGEFNDGKPVRIVFRPGPDITIGTLVMSPSPGRADVACAVPVPGGICGRPLAEGPCVIDHGKTEADGQASLFDPAEADGAPQPEPDRM